MVQRSKPQPWPKPSRIPPRLGIVIGLGMMALGPFLWVLSGTVGFPVDAVFAVLGIVLVPLGAIQMGRAAMRKSI
jgi:hypothetical protein